MPQGIPVKSILNKTKRRDPWFLDDYTANPYNGCSFNCLYCYIRGSKYGENMADKTSYKSNALELFEKELGLRAKKQQYGFIVISSATDPYLHFEEELKLTRGMLELSLKYKFPVHIITKSPLVERDFDILQEINNTAILPLDLSDKLKGVIISFSFSTINNSIGKIFEPGAPSPTDRLVAVRKSIAEGFKSGISLMPLLPYITDTGTHLREMLSAFKSANASYVLPATLTLFGNDRWDSKTLVLRAVEKHYPHLLAKYQNFFQSKTQMPDYYSLAFYEKMKELNKEFGVKSFIL
ncbi:MAG: radical SAM protein [Bacteroidia bacterium]|nr:radical SAM protein [Bacteroidia bacterium]